MLRKPTNDNLVRTISLPLSPCQEVFADLRIFFRVRRGLTDCGLRIGDWGLGIADWGLGIADWGLRIGDLKYQIVG